MLVLCLLLLHNYLIGLFGISTYNFYYYCFELYSIVMQIIFNIHHVVKEQVQNKLISFFV